MFSIAISAASIALVVLVVGLGLFLKDYRGAQAERADRVAITQVAQDNHRRWKNAIRSGEKSCKVEIASATKLAKQEASAEAIQKALEDAPIDGEGECGIDSSIRW